MLLPHSFFFHSLHPDIQQNITTPKIINLYPDPIHRIRYKNTEDLRAPVLLLSHLACFVLNKLKKQSNTTYQFCPLPHIQRLFMQKCSWGEEGCSCYQLLLLSFFPNFTCLTNQTIQSKNSYDSGVSKQAWLNKTIQNKRKHCKDTQSQMQKCSWGGERYQLLSTTALIFPPWLHLLNESNCLIKHYSHQIVPKQPRGTLENKQYFCPGLLQ